MRRLLLAFASTVALGCGPARPAFVRPNRPVPASPMAPARAEFPRGDGERVIRAAQAVLRASGARIAHRSEFRVETVARERDVPCGAGSCLARESIEVRVGHFVARLEIQRSLWNAATRSWDAALGPVEALDASAQERELLRRILAHYPTLALGELAAGPTAVEP